MTLFLLTLLLLAAFLSGVAAHMWWVSPQQHDSREIRELLKRSR